MSTQAERLRYERDRLGFSQAAFSEAIGVSRNTQINYESGDRRPDSRYLAAVASFGVDVLYVVTGKRTPSIDESKEPPPPDTLLPEERLLLDFYRQSDDRVKAAWLTLARAVRKRRPINIEVTNHQG